VLSQKYNGSNYDYLLVKYNSSLVTQSSITYNSSYNDYPIGVAINPVSHEVAITGYFYNTGTFKNNILTVWYNSNLVFQSSAAFSGVSCYSKGITVDKANTSNMYIGGNYADASSYLILKYTNRVFVSSAVYTCAYSGAGACSAITTDDSGNVFLAGRDDSPGDYLTLEYNPNLSPLRSMIYNCDYNGTATALAFDDVTGNLYVTGYQANIAGNYDITTLLYDSWNQDPVLSWCGSGNYTTDGLDPEVGFSSRTALTYRVTYGDVDSNAPFTGYPKVHIKSSGAEISGSPFTMTAFDNGTFTLGAGRQYTYSMTLPKGNYTYYFQAG
jgi:hypothetical protein